MFVVSLTSWRKRIGNVKKVVEAVMKNTVKPDRVYLNLSIEEFSGVPLPKDLIEYFYSDDRLIINWVDGPDTKSMKKVFPILKYLEPEDIIMTMDDDILLPDDFIEARMKDFRKYGGNTPITPVQTECWFGGYILGPTAVLKKKMLDNWDKFLTREVIETYNDDRTYLYIMHLNGYNTKPVTRYTKRGVDRMSYKANDSMRENGVYNIGKEYDGIVEGVVRNLTGTTIDKSHAFFKFKGIPAAEEGKYDCVLPWCHSGVASKMMECGKRLEIEYVVKSLYTFCKSWLGRVFVVGSEPPESIRDKVIHIPCDDPYHHAKDANIIHKIRYACEHIPDLSEDFVKISDDQIVTKETHIEDLKPRIIRMYKDWTEAQWRESRRRDPWHDNLYLTMRLFPLDRAYFAEPHIWVPFNKHKYIEMCNKYNYKTSRGCIDNTLYFNFINEPPVYNYDHLHLSRKQAAKIIPDLKIEDIPRHLSWTDNAFIDKRFRNILDKILFEDA